MLIYGLNCRSAWIVTFEVDQMALDKIASPGASSGSSLLQPPLVQVKLLENSHFRKVLSSHPIDNIPYNVLSEPVLLELLRSQLSPQLPANPSLEGVGIFFDPPDDLTAKQEVALPNKSLVPIHISS